MKLNGFLKWLWLPLLAMNFVTSSAVAQASPVIDYIAWQAPVQPRLKDVHRAMAFLRAQLQGGKAPKLTRTWRRDRDYRIVLLSLSRGSEPAKVMLGCGQGYRAALLNIVEQIRDRAILRQAKWLKLDIVSELSSPQMVRHGLEFELDPTLEGLANGDGRWILLAGEISAHTGYFEGYLNGGALSAALRMGGRYQPQVARQFRDPGLSVRRFRTFSYFSAGGETIPLFRDHRLFKHITPKVLEESLASAITYLVNATLADGSMVYTYLSPGNPQYSFARHGGTLFSMADYYQDYPNPELLAAIERARDYLVSQTRNFTFNPEPGPVLVERGAIKLTVMGLGVLALIKCYQISGDPELLKLIRGFADYIADSQMANGRFYDRRNYKDGKWRKEMESLYAPGEAVFALAELYAVDPDPKWIQVAEKGVAYLLKRQGDHIPLAQLEHDHWLLYGLNSLNRMRPKPEYVHFAMRLTQAIGQLQRQEHPIPDWIGSYYEPPRSTPTATRVEGLLAAFQIAVKAKQSQHAKRIWAISERSVLFLLQTQYRPENTMYFGHPHKAKGGFRGSFWENEIRIDFVQHNISAMLTMLRLMQTDPQAGGLAP